MSNICRFSAFLLLMLGACTPPQDIEASREALWGQFGDKPIDSLLMAWGTPMGETHLTDGSRMIEYRHATIYDSGQITERSTGCKVTFLAKSSSFIIRDIAMTGDSYECQMLSQGRIGESRIMSAPAPSVYYPPPYQTFRY